MTTAPTQAGPASPSRRAPATVATAVVVAERVDAALVEVLGALAGQSRPADHVLLLDTSADGALSTSLPELGSDLRGTRVLPVPGADPRQAVTAALGGEDPALPAGTTHVWLLTPRSVPEPEALGALVAALRGSPSAALAGPKLVRRSDPGRLHRYGIQATRCGRLVPDPRGGELDQGQYDHRGDALAVPFEGLLADVAVLGRLQGFDPRLGDLGGDLDLGWRAQQAGSRVVTVPGALVRVDDPAAAPTPSQRRQARRVALARCSWWAFPLLAAWVGLGGIVASLLLLLLKRPRAALRELGDVGAVLRPRRLLHSRSRRTVARRDIARLFVPAGAVAATVSDEVRDAVAFDSGRLPDDHGRAGAPAAETGPGADGEGGAPAEEEHERWLGGLARHPGVLAVLLSSLVTALAVRSVPGGLVGRLGDGLAGGQLVGVRASAGTLWHAWRDAWHGGGLGGDGATSPALVVVAAASWVVGHVPGGGGSPVATALAWGLAATLPLACASAYLAGRVLTRSRWPRAVAGVAWSTTALAGAVVGEGRVGAAVALVLLPAAAAGLVLASRRSGTPTAAFATALATAVLGAFVPGLALLVVLGALGVAVAGRGAARLRGLVVAVVPVVLLGPWVVTLAASPRLLLAGEGMLASGPEADPWQVALAHPGGSASFPALLSAPLVVVGVAGLLRTRGRPVLAWATAATGLLGLGVALYAPLTRLGTVDDLGPGATEVTGWAGLGLLVLVLALLAGALAGVDRLPLDRRRAGRHVLVRWPLVGLALAGTLASSLALAWSTVGPDLAPWQDPRPAVAVDQAEGNLAGRVLLVEARGRDVGYALVGRERSELTHAAPGAPTDAEAGDAGLAAAVTALVGDSATGSSHPPVDVLRRRAVGFVELSLTSPGVIARRLDGATGLTRIGDNADHHVWRVEPEQGVAPSRLRLLGDDGPHSVPVRGAHATTDVTLDVPPGARLAVAEPAGWSSHARVTADGQRLTARTGSGTPVYRLPAGTTHLVVDLPALHPVWLVLQAVALVLVGYLAVPFGTRASRRSS